MASTSTWQWVGDFVDIDKTYQQGGTLTTETRKEGTRQRIVVDHAMNDASIKMVGDLETSVTAYNGTQASVLYPVDTVTHVECSEEIFTPVEGGHTTFFHQKQKWTSWRVV